MILLFVYTTLNYITLKLHSNALNYTTVVDRSVSLCIDRRVCIHRRVELALVDIYS